MPQGNGLRCWGFISEDGHYAHCTRTDYACALVIKVDSSTYAHKLQGECRCGKSHSYDSQRPQAGTNGHKPQAGPVIRDEIRDFNGTLVAHHCRIGSGPGKKVWWEPKGLTVEMLPLYRAERLAALPDGAVVVVTEGEPATKALQGQGIDAVGTVTGAGAFPCDDVLQHLVRLSPILWPDNDSPGQLHMNRIAARLVDLGCQSVKAIEWLDAPPKSDAANAVAQGVDISALISSARPWVPQEGKGL